MRHVGAERRGAAFGAILACFDTGIGTGSTSMGWLIGRYGFASAFGTAAVLSALAAVFARRLPLGHASCLARRIAWLAGVTRRESDYRRLTAHAYRAKSILSKHINSFRPPTT